MARLRTPVGHGAVGWTGARDGRRGQLLASWANPAPANTSVEEAEPPHTDAGKDQAAEREAPRPFEEIAIMGPDVDIDPSGLAATIAVTTSIDAVCGVSYGIDEPAGSWRLIETWLPEATASIRCL